MKKIQHWFGGETELGDWKYVWNLRPGDIIKSEYDPSESVKMKGRQLVIEGFTRSFDRRFFVWARPTKRKRGIGFHTPKGLILLSRPGFKFKVGDLVRSAEIHAMTGIVIVICPERYRRKSYLVEYFDAETGYDSTDQYKEPWFPNDFKYPVPPKNREWCFEKMLMPL